MRRIDAHQHFWIYNPEEYPWMGDDADSLRRDFMPEDLAPLLESIGFDGSITVQARQMVAETEWLLELAGRYDHVLGVVGWLDLRSAEIGDQIERFVVDHIAKPPIADERTEPWATDMRELAQREHVTRKLSGMATEADRERWKHADFEPYLDIMLEAFGADRLMIGSDWPVCTLAGGYAPVMRIALDYVDRLSHAERDAIAGGTCARFYGIEQG
jgi:predicted TIM-barrel fold metal-dependent hydrolase